MNVTYLRLVYADDDDLQGINQDTRKKKPFMRQHNAGKIHNVSADNTFSNTWERLYQMKTMPKVQIFRNETNKSKWYSVTKI
jgi:hypothetical protein